MIQSHVHDIVRQSEMTLPLCRKDTHDKHDVTFISPKLYNINKTLFQEFITSPHRNFEHKLKGFPETKRLKISQGKVGGEINFDSKEVE